MNCPPPLPSIRSYFQCPLYPMLGNRLPIAHYWVLQTAIYQLVPKGSHLWFLTASTRLRLTQETNWPPLRQYLLWNRKYWWPPWRDRRTLSVFPPVAATSGWYPISKMYCQSAYGQSGNHSASHSLGPSSLVIQPVNQNTALQLSICVLCDRCNQMWFQLCFLALSFHHPRCTNHMDQKMIHLIQKPFRRGRYCCSVFF